MYQQAPITGCKGILTPTGAEVFSSEEVSAQATMQPGEDRPEGELGLWVHAED